MRNLRLFRYPIDAVSVLFVVLALGVQLTAFAFGWPWYSFFLILMLLRQVNLVEHNHSHLRIFCQRFLNELLGWICFLSNGVPLEFYEIHHVRNHHAFNQKFDESEQDWSSLYGFSGTRFPDRPVGRAYYTLSFPVITICHCLLEIVRAPGSRMFWRYLRSAGLITAASAVLIAIDPWRFLLFFFLPWTVVTFALGINSYDHHCGCELSNPYNSANVRLRLLHRFLGFNIGYHVAHHIRPALHWSRVPCFHETIKANIPPENYRPHRRDLAPGEASSGQADVDLASPEVTQA